MPDDHGRDPNPAGDHLAASWRVPSGGHWPAFWLNILLTLLGYIPGVIHAIWVILRK
jgi:hypothetical protein